MRYTGDLTGFMVGFCDKAQLLSTKGSELRAAGLYGLKIKYDKDLAARASDGRLKLVELCKIHEEMVIEKLVWVKGVGKWTAEMFLIFHLGRDGILPVVDLGLGIVMQEAYSLAELPIPEIMQNIACPCGLYYSVATLYISHLKNSSGLGDEYYILFHLSYQHLDSVDVKVELLRNQLFRNT